MEEKKKKYNFNRRNNTRFNHEGKTSGRRHLPKEGRPRTDKTSRHVLLYVKKKKYPLPCTDHELIIRLLSVFVYKVFDVCGLVKMKIRMDPRLGCTGCPGVIYADLFYFFDLVVCSENFRNHIVNLKCDSFLTDRQYQ